MDKNLTPRGTGSLSTFKDEIEGFFDRFSKELSLGGDTNFMPRIEVKDLGNSFLVSAELPGMNEKDISLSLDNNTLIIEGERKNESTKEGKDFFRSEFSYGSFYRAVNLSAEVNADKVKANYENGILKVTLDKIQSSEARSRKIEIGTPSTKH